jgi:hypothetical protein
MITININKNTKKIVNIYMQLLAIELSKIVYNFFII